ncbi:dihydroorotate dehydrogenase-like protein [Seleniivibrio woodruffii]|uniref:dihydroorotate dehydrogenase-like protein n=1 Tax=Seleniivibrio woodruffii TaxID=1078050 RepID=UPI0026EE91A5|nr:dihydroorotate dehydrogenase-like protein [Seleniivibrio woodruffii]
MPDISTTYMGIKLKSPVVAASSTLTKDIDNLKKAEEAGAGAVILKSLFEEEIRQDSGLDIDTAFHSEAYDYMSADAAMVYGAGEYLELVCKAVKAVSIPVIASVNCEGGKWWAEYAKSIEEAGAHGIELNISFMPFDAGISSQEAESRYFEVVHEVKKTVKIPVAVKIGQNITAVPYMVRRLHSAGASAVTLFNRYYQMKINTKTLELEPVHYFSQESEAYSVIRWVAAVAKESSIDISASTGVHNADVLTQYILAGASTVQVASMLYKKGFSAVTELNQGLGKWLDEHGMNLEDAVGLVLRKKIRQFQTLERVQYIKIADGSIIR